MKKAFLGARNALVGFPWSQIGWFEAARRLRGNHVARMARQAGCDLVLCSGTLDAPVAEGIDYAIWIDNTFALLQRSAMGLPLSHLSMKEIERLEAIAFNGASAILTFSQHVRASIIDDYGISMDRVHTVGCGSGEVPPFEGQKDFSQGHLLFVAKHLFGSKGGDLLLEAFPAIRVERPQTKLILIGNEEARSKAAGIDGVEGHGFIDRNELNRYFHGAAMLVQPMIADPWGQVYLEAMKARAVVVSLKVAALPELTDNGRLGVLVDKADPRKLADAVLATYARSQHDLDHMTREAQQWAIRSHSWEAVGDRVCDALGLGSQGMKPTR